MASVAEAVAVTPEEPRDQSPRTVDTLDLKRRFEQLRTDRKPVEGIWDQIDRFVMPLGSVTHPYVQVTEQSVEWSRWDVWDSTAIDGAQKLAASIHSSITSPANRWYRLKWRSQKLRSDNEAAAWLERAGDAAFDELQDSDFGVEIQASYQDLVGPGHAVVAQELVSEDASEWRGFDFTAIPLREWFYEEDSRGGILRGYRLLSWSPGQILERFGADCPKAIADKAKAGADLTQRIELVFALFRRPEAEKELKARRRKNAARLAARAKAKPNQAAVEAPEPLYPLAPHLRPVGAVYFLADTGEPLGPETGYYEMPVSTSPWQKTTGSRWGHGPGIIALPTIKHLNAYMEADLRAAEKVVDPTMLVTEQGLLSDPDLKPGGMTVVRDIDKSMKPLESGARFDVTERKLSELRAMVRGFFHVDELQLKDSPQMTAMEAQIRYELMQRVLGAPLNRIEQGLLSPIIERTFAALLRAGRLEKPPDSVQQELATGTAEYDVEYLGPLARSQRTDQVASIERLFAFAGALLKMGIPLPIVQSIIDMPEAVRQMAALLGCPADLLKAKEEVDQALQALDAAQHRAQEAAMQEQEGKAATAQAQLLAAHAQAMAGASGARGLPPGPVPAQPQPIIGPSFQPTSPFAQPPAPSAQ
jgi:hypothetical protein